MRERIPGFLEGSDAPFYLVSFPRPRRLVQAKKGGPSSLTAKLSALTRKRRPSLEADAGLVAQSAAATSASHVEGPTASRPGRRDQTSSNGRASPRSLLCLKLITASHHTVSLIDLMRDENCSQSAPRDASDERGPCRGSRNTARHCGSQSRKREDEVPDSLKNSELVRIRQIAFSIFSKR